MKSTMISKVAKVQALREAFPNQLGTMYSKEEQHIEDATYVDVKDEIDEIDPFIEDYYPKINIEEILANNKESAEVTKEKEKESKKPQIKPNYYYYHPYYGYYNYYYQRKR